MSSERGNAGSWIQTIASPRGLAVICGLVLTGAIVISQNRSDALAASQNRTPAAAAAAVEPKAGEKKFEDFDPASFDRSTQIDNEWMPLKPGTRFTYEGTHDRGRRHGCSASRRDQRDRSDQGDRRRSLGGDLGPRLQRRRARRGGAGVLRPGQRRQRLAHGRVPGGVRGREVPRGADLDPRVRGCASRNHDEGQAAAEDAQLLPGVGPDGRLDRPRTGRSGRPEDEGARRQLRGRAGDRRDQRVGARRRAAQVLRARRRQRSRRLARRRRKDQGNAGTGQSRDARCQGARRGSRGGAEDGKERLPETARTCTRTTPPAEPAAANAK